MSSPALARTAATRAAAARTAAGRCLGRLSRRLGLLSILLVTALAAGCGYSSRSISVVGPTPPTLESLAVTPADSTVPVGTPVLFTATGTYSDGSKQDLTGTVTWTSSAPAVATVGTTATTAGVATPLTAGTTTLTATLGTITGTTKLTVTTTSLLSIAVTPATATVVAGSTQAFTATGTYSDGTTQNLTSAVTWHIVNPAIASISPSRQGGAGVATGAAAGTTAVTATLNGITGQASLTVIAATLVSIAVTPTNPLIGVGATQTFTATGTFNNGTTQPLTGVTWASSNTGAATISVAGLATGIAPGLTQITAQDPASGLVSPPVTLTVGPAGAALTGLIITPAGYVIGVGAPLQFVATASFSNGTTLVVTAASAWVSSAPAVATVSNVAGRTGLATGVALGQTTISASFGGIATTPQGTADGVLLTVSGPVAFAANYNANNVANGDSVAQFSIGANGELTPFGPPLLTGSNSHPYALAIDASGRYLYSANYVNKGVGVGTVGQFAIDPASGVLTQSAPPVNAGVGPNHVLAHPTLPYVYVVDYDGGTVSQFNIGPTGLLTPMAIPAVPAGTNPSTIAIDPAGAHAYVANFGGGVSQYGVNPATGSLGPLPGPNAPTGTNANYIVVHPTGRFAYVANDAITGNNGNSISQYTINADGTLAPMTPAAVPAGTKPRSITLDAAGRNAYVTNETDNTVGHYLVDPTSGALSLAETVPAGSGPNFLALDPTGHFAYVADRGNGSNSIAQFAVDPNTGVLTPLNLANATSGAQPTWVTTAR